MNRNPREDERGRRTRRRGLRVALGGERGAMRTWRCPWAARSKRVAWCARPRGIDEPEAPAREKARRAKKVMESIAISPSKTDHDEHG